jgi:hypothetical protein
MEFGCSLCEYTSSQKENVLRHINRKKSCGVGIKEIVEIPIDIICEFCNKSFTTKKHLNDHIKNRCIGKDKAKDEEIRKLKGLLLQRTIQNQQEQQDQQEQHSETNSMYIIQEREFLNLRQPVYKIGITKKVCNRMGQYPKGSKIICIFPVDGDPEALCLQQFRTQFIPRIDIGSEYFEGDINTMVSKLVECCT